MHGLAFRSYLDVGLYDTIDITSDGGATWQKHTVGGLFYGRYVYYIPGTVGTYVGSSGLAGTDQGVCYSYDGGLNWTTIISGYDFQATAWTDVATGWAGTTSTAKKSTGGMYIYAGDSLLPLEARFQADYTAISLGQSVTFTNLSSGIRNSSAWVFQGGNPPTYSGNTPPPVVYNTPGTYNVRLIVTNDFTSDTLLKTGYIYVGGVGINELSQNAVTVFPNPVRDVMTVQSAGNIKEIQVYNVTGQLVISQTVNAKTITVNTSGLNTGIYTMKAILDNGTINKKIVIQ
jgi:PKD repeat protein